MFSFIYLAFSVAEQYWVRPPTEGRPVKLLVVTVMRCHDAHLFTQHLEAIIQLTPHQSLENTPIVNIPERQLCTDLY